MHGSLKGDPFVLFCFRRMDGQAPGLDAPGLPSGICFERIPIARTPYRGTGKPL